MNATSLYVSTCRLVLQADSEDSTTWTDLYRLVPYLRQSLSCTVCGNLLIEPYTPTETNCQHHVCRSCKGGRKKLKPSCSWCKNYDKYVENVQLRILLQCYKKLCEYVTSTSIYRNLRSHNNISGSSSLVDLIQEGAGFKDEYKSTAGLTKSAYSILPCVYTSTSTQTAQSQETDQQSERSENGSPLYSVLFAGSGNKITIKRKAAEMESENIDKELYETTLQTFKKSSQRRQSSLLNTYVKYVPGISTNSSSTNSNAKSRKGCRCGNATPTPGKLTCCGQRCPCYVDGKACIDCKCRGCRNPHTPDGQKVLHQIPLDLETDVNLLKVYTIPSTLTESCDEISDIEVDI